MAENQMERGSLITAQTYIEDRVIPHLPKDYTEEELQKKFAAIMESLREKLNDYDEYRHELDEISNGNNETGNSYSAEELSREYIYLNRSRQPVQKQYDTTKKYSGYLHEYGDEFAQLYRIKDNNEKYGNPEKLELIEVDITDNGDMLTQDQYFKMRADRDERVRQLALHVEDQEAEVEFNIGMMEYNQPNTPPQIKMQLSFDEETQEELDAAKLNAIFAFCEVHGLSVADMEIRNFDGTLAESAIREKINQVLNQRQADKAAQIAEANAKEYEAQRQREKEIETELQNVSLANNGVLPESILSGDEISYDVPDTKMMMTAMMPEYMAEGKINNGMVMEEASAEKVKRIAKGMATAAIPDSDVPDHLDKHLPEGVTIPEAKGMVSTGTKSFVGSKAEAVASPEVKSAVTPEVKSAVTPEIKSAVTPEIKSAVTPEGVAMPEAKDVAASVMKAVTNSETADVANPGAEVEAEGESVAPRKSKSIASNASEISSTEAPRSFSIPIPESEKLPEEGSKEEKKIKQSEVVDKFEKFIQEGLGKEKNLSYFKTRMGVTGRFFGERWTEFIIYDTEDPKNRRKDGVKDKNGTVKYTYSLKLFINVDSEGVLHFAYRVPNHRKIDESVLGGIVGQLKDLGYTAIAFPKGMPTDAEKGMWRKAMAEKGIVPIGMGLDKSKAEGMLKAAKEKLSAEDLAEYKYRLAKQMNKHNQDNGKKISVSEQAFIDGLINSYHYGAFTDAYANVFKGKIKKILRTPEPQDGAVKKIAAYVALRRVFDVYKSALDRGGDILNAEGLSPEEKKELRGLTGPVTKFTNQQMDKLFDVLYQHDLRTGQTEKALVDQLMEQGYSDISVYGAKATVPNIIKGELNIAVNMCEGINDDLTALGIDKIEIIKMANLRLEFKKFIDARKKEYEASKKSGGSKSVEISEGENKEKSEAPVANQPDNNKPAPQIARNMAQNKGQTYN